MTKCEKMEQFINDHTDIAMKFMLWEDTILKDKQDDSTDITDIDFDIVS